jgi:quercetin dioxygenase-like cupin family protein
MKLESVSNKTDIFNEKDVGIKKFDNRWAKFVIGSDYLIKTDKLNCGIVEYFNDRVSEYHEHDEEEVIYIIRGSGKICIGDKTHNVKKGDFISIPKNVTHSAYSDYKKRLKLLFMFLK